MSDDKQFAQSPPAFGGAWTEEKLDILERYLNAYTTALKNGPFQLMYIDAFAGAGRIALSNDEASEFLSGSAERAARVDDKPFDKLIFVEKDIARCKYLESLRNQYGDRNIQIENSDANEFLSRFDENWNCWRGVLFLDPYATQVKWSTIEKIAGFEALDTWILFPAAAIARILPVSRNPDDIDPTWADHLTAIYGGENWRDLYRQTPQQDLFLEPEPERQRGVNGLISIYKKNLQKLFSDRFLETSRSLRNSKKSVLFELMFCVGSPGPKAIGAAQRIARHILEKL